MINIRKNKNYSLANDRFPHIAQYQEKVRNTAPKYEIGDIVYALPVSFYAFDMFHVTPAIVVGSWIEITNDPYNKTYIYKLVHCYPENQDFGKLGFDQNNRECWSDEIEENEIFPTLEAFELYYFEHVGFHKIPESILEVEITDLDASDIKKFKRLAEYWIAGYERKVKSMTGSDPERWHRENPELLKAVELCRQFIIDCDLQLEKKFSQEEK
jgi:hypothetical protein